MRIGALGVGQFRENWPYLVGPVACPAEAGVGGGCPLDAVMVAAAYLAKKGSDGSMDEVRLFFLQREIYLGERCMVIVERVRNAPGVVVRKCCAVATREAFLVGVADICKSTEIPIVPAYTPVGFEY